MSSKIKFLLFFSFISFCATAQVKIGQNPNTIHSASIVELESTDKAFVLTRLSTAQMQAITPLNGAVVYNTDTQCVHYFNGTVWTNLCDGINTNDFSFTDNGDGTITLDDGNGNTITFNGAAQTISTLIDNGDGTYTYTNENGIETVISIAVTDNQNLLTDNTPGNISIDNGNTLTINVDDADADAQNEIQTLDYTSGVLTLSNDPNATVVDLSAFDQNAADDFSGSYNDLSDLPANLDIDATDDFNTAITFDGTNLTVSDAGGDVSTDISGLAYDDTALRADVDQNTADIDALETEQTTQNNSIATNAADIDNLEAEQTTQNNSIATNATDISTNAAAIAAHNSADGDLSDSNEYNTGISFDGTDLTVTDLGGDQTVDISGLAYDDTALRADVDQNTADIDALEAEQTTQNNSIATNATDISTNAAAIAAHNSADGDLSDSNEYNTGISFDGTDLTVTDLGGDQTVNISGLAYDDTTLRADVDQNTADIDALETEQTTQNNSIATNATDIDNLEAEQTTQNNSIATNATDIDNLEAEQTTQNNSIATNASDISTNAAAIATHNSADGDLSDSNEYNTGISFDGTDLTVTDLGGDQTVDISGLAYDDTALRADVDQNTADIDALETEQTTQNTNIATNATDIDNLEAEQTSQNNSIATNATDIDNLEAEQTTQNNSIATNATDIDALEAEQTTQNNSIATNATDISTNAAAIAAHNTADGDLSDSNEYNTGISFDGTDLTVTDLGGDQSVDISGLAYDDTTLRADVDQNTADIDALETEQTTQNNSITTNATDISTNTAAIAAHNTADGDLSDSNEYNTGISFDGTDLTVTDLGGDQTVDISGLAYDDTALRADVDQNTADIDALETEQTTQNNSIATNATDIDNLEAEQTTQNNSITTNATDISTNTAAIAAHNSADGDLSDSNEYNTGISFDGTDLTVTDLGGDQTVDISGLAYDDTALRANVDQNTADIDALETEQTTQNNSITTNATDISTNTAAIAAHNTADGDLSDSNEYNTGISFDGTDLTVTDLGGDQTVDISGLAYDDTALRTDVDQNTADIDALEAEQTTQNNSIATNATDIDNLEAEQTTQNNSISSNSAAIAAHNTADEDLSATNETNTSFSTVDVAGTDYLRISDSNGDLDVPLSDLSHTGTTGSVFFAGADGTPTENNGQLFWNSNSNSLGVGTSSPTNKLHVSGAIRSQGILNSNGTENEPAYRFNDDTNTGMFRPAADEIAFTVGGIEAMKIEETSSDTSVIINETLELEGAILDENDSPGTAGQVLTSTATGTEWVNSMSPIKAIGKISAAGGVTKATAGVTVTRISVGYYRVTLPTGAVSDADYIIQLTQPGRGGAGNDDPGISYSNQTATSFEVIIGDNDNGGTDRSRFDSEFMFTVLDL
ncbi:beta strand repeat-containing protein [Maribacter dokdonensis]|uniref:beta strand repeat-containing protein n=2 Tax=Maribacter dokdonensis TaxID=320912 RepID=UPI0032983855